MRCPSCGYTVCVCPPTIPADPGPVTPPTKLPGALTADALHRVADAGFAIAAAIDRLTAASQREETHEREPADDMACYIYDPPDRCGRCPGCKAAK